MITNIAELITKASRITALTGAGVSAESGIPTFRDAMTGLWAKFDPHELATLEAFERNPAQVSRWYDERRQMCARCKPNAGHLALVQLEAWCRRNDRKFTLITQNVDRLHHAAGSNSIVELHGTLWVWRCIKCGTETEERGGPFDNYPLRCGCGGLCRPGVVWFGEMLPAAALQQADQAALACDLFISLGTSSVVEPAASFVYAARECGTVTVEINLDSTPISNQVDYSFRGKTGEVLPEIMEMLFESAQNLE